MAAQVQRKGATGNTSSPTVVTLDAAASSGNLIEVSVMSRQPSGGGVTLTVTDDAGNTYTKAVSAPATGDTAIFERFAAKYYAKNVSGAPQAITVTQSATLGANLTVIVAEYSGLDTTAPLDKTATGSASSGTTPATAATGTLAQADELVTCCVFSSSGTPTEDTAAGYTLTHIQGVQGDEYKVVSATTAVTGTWTLSASSIWRVALATYKAAAAGGGTTVTPTTASLTLAAFAPTVSTPRTVTPGPLALALTSFAPTVSTPRTVTPGTAALTLTTFAPSVGSPVEARPGPASLTLTTFAPAVSTPRLVTPGAAGLTLAGLAPTVSTPRLVTPGAASLALAGFAPTVNVSGDRLVTPGALALSLQAFAPTVSASGSPAPGRRIGLPGRDYSSPAVSGSDRSRITVPGRAEG